MEHRVRKAWLIGVGLLLCLAQGMAQTGRERSEQLLRWLQEANGDSIYAHLNAQMKRLVTVESLAGMWKALEQQAGACEGAGAWGKDAAGGVVFHYVDLKFRQVSLRFLAAFDADGRANTLRLMPVPPQEKPLPAVFDSLRLEERPVEIVTGGFRLPGTVTLPRGGKRLPVVVLVHGFGPQDRDGTIGPNKVYRDLAWGLASEGAAVVRYDKRTFVYKERSALPGQALTPEEETAEDALSAVRLAMELPFADKKRVVLVGHSLGGLLAPYVASRCDSLAGIVLMAAPARPLLRVMEEQVRYLSSLEGQADEGQIRQQTELLRRSAPQEYWAWLDRYQPVMTAYRLRVPMLFLQGERDYQVTMEDFSLWRMGMFGKKNATFKSYPSLNHCFMEGSGRSTPMEYSHPARVAPQPAKDIMAWINENVR